MAKGSIGANCSTIIHRRQKSVPCSCPKCSHYRIVDGVKTSVPYKTDEKVIVKVKALNTLKTIIKNE